MSVRAMAARRVALAVVATWLVFTAAFVFVAATPDPNMGSIRFGAAMSCEGTSEEREACIERKMEAYREANNLDEPVLDRYVSWLGSMVSLRWGASVKARGSVTDAIARTLPYTLLYVVPSMLLSTLGGLAVGSHIALNPEGWRDRAATLGTYLGYGVPNFWLAAFVLAVVGHTYSLPGDYIFSWDPAVSGPPLAPGTLVRMVFPVAVLSTTLLASQLRHARSETLEHAGSEFVKLVRAKGFGDRGVTRHILRATAPLLLSLFVVDLFSVIVVNVFVLEFVFEIPGFGDLALRGIKTRDMPVIMGTTMVIAIVGIAGNLLKDLATLALDPRIGDGER